MANESAKSSETRQSGGTAQRRLLGDPVAISKKRLEPRGGTATLEELLKQWLKSTRTSQRAARPDIASAWASVVGPDIAQHTRAVDLARGELLVEVSSAALLTELSTYYRQGILESLRRIPEFEGVQKLRFRAGAF